MATITPQRREPHEHEPLTDPTVPHADGLLARIGTFSANRKARVLLLWLVVALVAAPLALTVTSALSGAGWEPQGGVSGAVSAATATRRNARAPSLIALKMATRSAHMVSP